MRVSAIGGRAPVQACHFPQAGPKILSHIRRTWGVVMHSATEESGAANGERRDQQEERQKLANAPGFRCVASGIQVNARISNRWSWDTSASHFLQAGQSTWSDSSAVVEGKCCVTTGESCGRQGNAIMREGIAMERSHIVRRRLLPSPLTKNFHRKSDVREPYRNCDRVRMCEIVLLRRQENGF